MLIDKVFYFISNKYVVDRPHGCNKQNRLFKEKWGMDKMMLHAKELNFKHPISEKELTIAAPLSEAFENSINLLSFKPVNNYI